MWLTKNAVGVLLAAGIMQGAVVEFDDYAGSNPITDGYGGITWNGNWNRNCCPAGSTGGLSRVGNDARFDFDVPNQVFNGLGVLFPGTVSVNLFDDGGLVSSFEATGDGNSIPFFASSYGGNVDYVVLSLVSSPTTSSLSGWLQIDDVTFGEESGVPEPGTYWLAAEAFGILALYIGVKRGRSGSQ